MNMPHDLRYTRNDEWIRAEGTLGTCGITDYAQSQLSDVVFFEVRPAVGAKVAQGEAIGTVESVKAASEIYAPVTGTVTEVHQDLAKAPETINRDPYGEAWMIRFQIADPQQVQALMDAAAYEKYCQERSH